VWCGVLTTTEGFADRAFGQDLAVVVCDTVADSLLTVIGIRRPLLLNL